MRASGILLPVFSLPSACGIGDLYQEAYKFIDRLSEAGQKYWQVLPIGPVNKELCPYQSSSSFAGEALLISLEKLEAIADEIEQELQGKLDREISTVEIGEMVMKRLKEVDEVAYVRFASVYRSFKDINTFMEELSKLLTEPK